MKKSITISILLYVSISIVLATNVYVSKSGSDTNSGSREEPFLTITKASSVIRQGDTCFIMAGTYREELIGARSGTAEKPIVFKAFGTDSVVVSATEVVEGWSQHQGAVYKVPVSMSMGRQNMLYFNGKAMDWARWPNNTDDYRFSIDASPIEGGSASTVIDEDIPDLQWVGGYMWYLGAHSGASWTRQITGFDHATHTISFSAVDINKWPFSPHNPTVYRNGNRGRIFLFGILSALDHPGEWHYDGAADTLYFQAPGNVDPALHHTEVCVRSNTIRLMGDYVHVDGIHAFGGRVLLSGDHCVVRNGTLMHCMEILDELDNTDAQMHDGSVKVEGSYALIENNVIEYGSSNGIAMLYAWAESKNNTVRNNVIRYFNTIGIHSCGIRSNCSGTRIIGNTIYGCGRDGVYVSGGNSEIAYNDIASCMRINNDGGVFYTVGNQSSKNTEIHHNWFHDSYGPSYADGRAAGIYLDNDSKGYDVHHNVVWNVTWSGLQMNWDNWYNNIVNNSFWQVGQAMGNWLNGRELIDNRIYNNYASVGNWVGNEFEANIIDPSSPFANAGNRDFTPARGSVLIDEGVPFEGITTASLGIAPDVGAYEYGLTPWRPGVNYEVGGDTFSNLEVEFVSPAAEEVFAFPADVLVEAENVNGEEGVIMTLYLDDQPVGTDSAAPFVWDPAEHALLSGLELGDYSLKIVATDVNGYPYTITTGFSVISSRVGDVIVLGNGIVEDGTENVWTSNLVINETDIYTNRTDSTLYIRVDSFGFHAQAKADPVTPFIVHMKGKGDFTVLAIGDTRTSETYAIGPNLFPFMDRADTVIALPPGDTLATGFLDAYPDGSGGGAGPVIPYDQESPTDQLWYTGGPAWYQSGSVTVGEPPHADTPPRDFYYLNYHFYIGFTITDTQQTIPTGERIPSGAPFTMYPNPVSDEEVVVSFGNAYEAVEIAILDLQGRVIYKEQSGNGRVRFHGSDLPYPGTYLVKVRSGGRIAFGKIVKL